MDLRKLSFILSLVGTALLLSMLIFPSFEIKSLERVDLREKVFLEGVVENERKFGDFTRLDVNGIDVVCECSESYLGKEIIIEGVVEEYLGEKQVRALRIQNLG